MESYMQLFKNFINSPARKLAESNFKEDEKQNQTEYPTTLARSQYSESEIDYVQYDHKER